MLGFSAAGVEAARLAWRFPARFCGLLLPAALQPLPPKADLKAIAPQLPVFLADWAAMAVESVTRLRKAAELGAGGTKAEAAKLLEKIGKLFPKTKFAELAGKRAAELK